MLAGFLGDVQTCGGRLPYLSQGDFGMAASLPKFVGESVTLCGETFQLGGQTCTFGRGRLPVGVVSTSSTVAFLRRARALLGSKSFALPSVFLGPGGAFVGGFGVQDGLIP